MAGQLFFFFFFENQLNVKPRDYQISTLEEIIDKLQVGAQRLVVLSPAGSGKSVLCNVLASYLSKHEKKRVLFLTGTRALEAYAKHILSTNKITDYDSSLIHVSNIHDIMKQSDKRDLTDLNEYDYILIDGFEDSLESSNPSQFLKTLNQLSSKIIMFQSVLKSEGVLPVIKVQELINFDREGLKSLDANELKSITKQLDNNANQLLIKLQKELGETKAEVALYQAKITKLETDYKTITDKFNIFIELFNDMNSKIDEVKENTAEIKKDTNEIKGDIKDIKHKIEEILVSLNNLQSEVSKILLKANSEEEKEKIYHEFSNVLLQKVIKAIDTKESDKYNDNKKELINLFRERNWDKLTPESKEYLITSRIVYDNLSAYDNQVDFSAACIPITKALEREIFINLFNKLKSYCREKGIPLRDWPDGLIENYNGRYSELDELSFTLGKVSYIIGRRSWRSRRVFIMYCKERLFREDLGLNDTDLNNYLDDFKSKIEQIKNDYRNKAAHKDEIKKNDAEACYKYIISVEKVLVDFMDKIKV